MTEFKNLIKDKEFLSLWISQMFSQLTINIMNFIILTRLFTITGSTIATSLLWIAYALPAIFFGPIGAASVDLVSRRKILMVTNLLQAATVGTLIFVHQTNIFILYVVVLLYSFFNQFYVPAESSSLPSVVPKRLFPHANSLFFITQQAALVVGFGTAGIILNFLGFTGSLVVCTILLVVAFVSVSFLPEIKPRLAVPQSMEKLVLTFFRSIYEGYKFIKEHKKILFPLILLLGIQVSLAMAVVNIPLIATQILGVDVNFAGILVVVPAGLGAMAASVLISKNLKKTWRKKYVIETASLILAIALLLIVFVIPLLAFALRVIFEPLFVFLLGVGYIGIIIPTLTYLQETTPSWLRGRVFGNFWFLSTIASVFPVLFSGVITEFFGIKTLFILLATAGLFVFYYSKNHGEKLIEENFINE
ncbi:MAG TPA: MFS transporter [Patescibacteria group bacterium]|nr:MFS transporter [Patescibacteria group bacterium]